MLESMIALACFLIVLNSMQVVHVQLSLSLNRAQQSLNQHWSFDDLSQRLVIFSPLLKQQMTDNKQVSNVTIKKLKSECVESCEALDELFEQIDEWQLQLKNNKYFINQHVQWTLVHNNPELLLTFIVSDTNNQQIVSVNFEI